MERRARLLALQAAAVCGMLRHSRAKRFDELLCNRAQPPPPRAPRDGPVADAGVLFWRPTSSQLHAVVAQVAAHLVERAEQLVGSGAGVFQRQALQRGLHEGALLCLHKHRAV